MGYFNGILLEGLGQAHRLREAKRLFLSVLGCDVFNFSVCQHCLDRYFLRVRIIRRHTLNLILSSQPTK